MSRLIRFDLEGGFQRVLGMVYPSREGGIVQREYVRMKTIVPISRSLSDFTEPAPCLTSRFAITRGCPTAVK